MGARDAGGAPLHAIHTAQATIACEPLRESARCTLIESYLAEGNLAEAHRELDRFSVLLWSELKVRPWEQLRRRVDDALAPGASPPPSRPVVQLSVAARLPAFSSMCWNVDRDLQGRRVPVVVDRLPTRDRGALELDHRQVHGLLARPVST